MISKICGIVDEMGLLGGVVTHTGEIGEESYECPCGCGQPYVDCFDLGLTAHSYNPAIRQCQLTKGDTGCSKKGCMEGHCFTFFDPSTRGLRMRDETTVGYAAKTHEDANDPDTARDPPLGEEDVAMAGPRMLALPAFGM